MSLTERPAYKVKLPLIYYAFQFIFITCSVMQKFRDYLPPSVFCWKVWFVSWDCHYSVILCVILVSYSTALRSAEVWPFSLASLSCFLWCKALLMHHSVCIKHGLCFILLSITNSRHCLLQCISYLSFYIAHSWQANVFKIILDNIFFLTMSLLMSSANQNLLNR